MIAIALIAIVFGVATSTFMQFGALQRQLEYDNSLTQSTSQLEKLRQTDFNSLPPEVCNVGRDKSVLLSHKSVLKDSILVRDASNRMPISDWTFDAESSRLKLKQFPSRGTVIVEYEFYLGSQNLSRYADNQAHLFLPREAGFELHGLYAAEGDNLVEVSDYNHEEGKLILPPRFANQLIVLDYSSEEKRNKVSGTFVDDSFHKTQKVTSTKLIEVQEPFAGGWKMSIPLLKEQHQ